MATSVHDLQEFQAEAVRFALTLQVRAGHATVVALAGELGAGKTTFVQAAAHFLGIEFPVTSPTFVIEKIYELNSAKWKRLIHIDAYRLNGAHELEALGWKEIAADPDNLILIEWPERVAELIPADAYRISFTSTGDSRTISYA